MWFLSDLSGLILGSCPPNDRWCHFVTASLIALGWSGSGSTACKTYVLHWFFSLRISETANMEIHPSNTEHGRVENHPFYKCIQPLIILQKVTGGWIHRPRQTSGAKHKKNALFVYCLFLVIMTIAALLRTAFFFTKNVSVQTSQLYIYLIISCHVATGSGQIMSIFKYNKILQFWDGLLSRYPQDLNDTLKMSRAIIQILVIIPVIVLLTLSALSFYFILSPKPEPLLQQYAQPWSDSRAPQLIVLATLLGFMPSIGSWFGASLLFLVAGYYLCRAFRGLYRGMEVDQHLMTELASYKMQHFHLSQLTAMLDDILWGYIGTTVGMSTFDFCLIIFALEPNQGPLGTIIPITTLFAASSGMAVIFTVSIALGEWVSAKCKWLYISWPAMFDIFYALGYSLQWEVAAWVPFTDMDEK